MNSQELRALQEAYNQVCELDEGKKEFPHKKVDKQVYDAMDSGETAGDAGNRAKEKRDYGRADRMRSVAAKHGGKSRVREETDLFDYILEHLVAEGYADTNKAALAIMANMSEEWRESIVENRGMSYSGGKPGASGDGGKPTGITGGTTYKMKGWDDDKDAKKEKVKGV
jgi:hypothetical protein